MSSPLYQADLGMAPRSTNERKQMSTKTIFKRLALVVVSALGLSMLSIAPVRLFHWNFSYCLSRRTHWRWNTCPRHDFWNSRLSWKCLFVSLRTASEVNGCSLRSRNRRYHRRWSWICSSKRLAYCNSLWGWSRCYLRICNFGHWCGRYLCRWYIYLLVVGRYTHAEQ